MSDKDLKTEKPAPAVVKPQAPTEKAPEGKMFGNKDAEGKYPFDASFKNSVVARLSVITKTGPEVEDVAEVKSSVQYQPFEPYMFDKLKKENAFEGKRVIVVHDPRLK